MARRQVPFLDEDPQWPRAEDMSAARDQIFGAIRAALDPLPARAPRPAVPHGVADALWLAGEADPVALFVKRAQAVGTVCFANFEECRHWLLDQSARKIHLSPGLAELQGRLTEVGEVVLEYSREVVDEVEVAITPAAAGIAESGTIVLTDESTPDRLAALAPWIHIAVLPREAIHRSIADAIAALPDDPNVIWVTGPSKTADVEGILIQGVHGPGIQGCLLV
jgi:L-lactate dehydrogenase complex protein LldG